jgi:hypothetical protein
MRTIPRDELATADLYVDATYQGDRSGNAGDDPLPDLLGVSNQGGFRYLGTKEQPRLVVLTTSFADPEWPDELDAETGVFTYFGDNKKPGHELHDTRRFGNLLLRDIFNAAHTANRDFVPPILVFSNAGIFRDKAFLGLAVPGAPALSQLEDLVAVWKNTAGQRFQNYRAKLSILDVARVSRDWLLDIRGARDPLVRAPAAWVEWVRNGRYLALRATRALDVRTKTEQLPSTAVESEMLSEILRFFSGNSYGFEACAAEIARLVLANVTSIDLTRPTRDGGRDAIGLYQIGNGPSSISVDFAIEAKCYAPENSVGVRELSRLISRLRHRQFGMLVTTSWVHSQAYTEIREDGHPIIIISGTDIVRILKTHGIATPDAVGSWLQKSFNHREPTEQEVPLGSV